MNSLKRGEGISVAIRWEPWQHHSVARLDFHGALLFFLLEGIVPQQHIYWRQYNPNIMPDKSTDVKRQRREAHKVSVIE